MAGTSSTLEFHHRFKFPVEWDDEEFLLASVNMVSQNGPMLSVSKSFGLGNSQVLRMTLLEALDGSWFKRNSY